MLRLCAVDSRVPLLLAVACATTLAAQAAHAAGTPCQIHGPGAPPVYGTFAEGAIHNQTSPDCPDGSNPASFRTGTLTSSLYYDGSAPTNAASGSVGADNSGIASASANLFTGRIAVSSKSLVPVSGGSTILPASAEAGFFVNDIVFSGAAPHAQGQLVMSGTLSGSGDYNALGGLYMFYGGYPGVGAAFPITPGPTWSLTWNFPIYNNVDYTFYAALRVYTSSSFLAGQATASDPISFALPPGVTFTSSDPGFLTGAPVPEPSAWAMVLVGLGAAGAAMRRQWAAATKPSAA